ncbi:MAG TPA: multiheme c-type cytochrome [bacterium]|nr:multiheme c-type cytochrome [bacterium]
MAKRLFGGGLVWVSLLLFLMVLLAGCERRPVNQTSPQVSSASDYVGAEACKACHEEIYNGWKATFHAYKFQPASPDVIVGDFQHHNTLKAGGSESRMHRNDKGFVVTTIGPDGQLHDYPVRYVVGSVWKQRYITEFPNGGLFVLPVQWNVKSQEWVDYFGLKLRKPGDGLFWSDAGREFQYQCMGCHTTNSHVDYDAATQKFNTQWTDLGVTCEACHGPGRQHIAAKIQDKASTIINPAKMADPKRAAMICGACHTRGTSQNGKFAYATSYKPGGQLNFAFDEKPAVYPDGSPKEHHQQYNDWEASGHATSGVMCWDCHSPHARGKSNRFQLKLPGSMLCTTCHQVKHTGYHGLHSVNNCIGCHMPSTVQSATPNDLRSHRMTVVRPELTVEAGGDVNEQPNSCNLCHYHKDYDPEDLVHMMKAAQKPMLCKSCHDKEEPGD